MFFKTLNPARMAASLALVLLALSGAPARAADDRPYLNPPSAADRLKNGRAAIASKDWKKAIDEFSLVVRDQPRNADAHNLLAYSYRKQSSPDLPRAFEHYRTALSINPDHKGAHEYIGEAYLMDKKPEEAEKHLAALEKICGNRSCEEYADLFKAIADYKARR